MNIDFVVKSWFCGENLFGGKNLNSVLKNLLCGIILFCGEKLAFVAKRRFGDKPLHFEVKN